MQPVLHTLNAVRVIAEYCIVSFHIEFGHQVSTKETYDISHFFSSHAVSVDFMSLFFVLSGFVAMYTNPNAFTDHLSKAQFIANRFKKTYPCYILSLLAGLPQFVIDYTNGNNQCTKGLVGLLCQLIGIQCWIGYRFAGANTASWYLSTLYWLWIIFPYLKLQERLCYRPWVWVIAFYAVSIALNAAFVNFDNANTRQLPLIRIFDFLIGCAAAHTLNEQHGIRGGWVVLSLIVYFIYASLATVYSEQWQNHKEPYQCVFWQKYTDNITLKPGSFVSLTSILWALVLHWLAKNELENSDNIIIELLSFDFFKSLSSYSLQLYLFHCPINKAIQESFKLCGAYTWLSKDIIMVGCYCFSYCIYTRVQPRLDRVTAIICGVHFPPPLPV